MSLGLPAIAPALRQHYGLSIAEVGVALAAVAGGMIVTMLGWGMLADRIGERLVMSIGLVGAAAAMLLATRAGGAGQLTGALALAGCFGASVNAASGRAVAGWFPAAERGLAMGVRQGALPLGGAAAAATLPAIAGADDAPRALAVLAAVCAAGALAAAVGMRDPAPAAVAGPVADPHPIRNGRVWQLTAVSFLLVLPQLALLSFVALYLHDERGLSAVAAGAVLAVAQLVGVAARIAVGLRLGPAGHPAAAAPPAGRGLRRHPGRRGGAAAGPGRGDRRRPRAGRGARAVLERAGLPHRRRDRAAEPPRRAALGLQNTAVVIAGTLAPIGFGLAVAGPGWTTAFALLPLAPAAALVLLRPLVRTERVPV